jgi:hypothetical protein
MNPNTPSSPLFRNPGQGMGQFSQWNYNGRWYTDDYYHYNIGPGTNGAAGTIAAAATANTQFTVQADSNFEWIYSTWFGYKDGVTTPASDGIQVPISLLITDGGSGRQLMSQAVPISSMAGVGREVYVLPKRRIFMSKSTVLVVFNNFGADQYDNVSFTLHGRKIFDLT